MLFLKWQVKWIHCSGLMRSLVTSSVFQVCSSRLPTAVGSSVAQSVRSFCAPGSASAVSQILPEWTSRQLIIEWLVTSLLDLIISTVAGKSLMFEVKVSFTSIFTYKSYQVSIRLTDCILRHVGSHGNFFLKMGHSRPLFYFRLSITVDSKQMFHIEFCRWLDVNRGPLVLEATTLPTEPQPLPKVARNFLQYRFLVTVKLKFCSLNFGGRRWRLWRQ